MDINSISCLTPINQSIMVSVDKPTLLDIDDLSDDEDSQGIQNRENSLHLIHHGQFLRGAVDHQRGQGGGHLVIKECGPPEFIPKFLSTDLHRIKHIFVRTF